MWWRKPRPEYEAGKGEINRATLHQLVNEGRVPGLIAYANGEPVGWCSIGPRSDFVRLNTARTLKPLDDQPVWSIVCLFIRRAHRRQGVSVALVDAACNWAFGQGARLIESYPVVPRQTEVPDMTAWTGFPAIFERAGFTLAARPTEARAIYRRGVQA
jgi:GNAT superfamily N-acetyltransferase